MADRHLGQMILDRARERPQSVAFRVRRDAGYADITWGEVLPRVDAVAAGLLSAAPLTEAGSTPAEALSKPLDSMLRFAGHALRLEQSLHPKPKQEVKNES